MALIEFYQSEPGKVLLADSPLLAGLLTPEIAQALERVARVRGELIMDRQFYLDWHGQVNFEDLKALHSFFQTDIGREVADTGPALAKDLATEMRTRLADIQLKVQLLAQEALAQLKTAEFH